MATIAQPIINICEVDDSNFEEKALEIFRYQFLNNETYQQYCKALKKMPESVKQLTEIPFLPIQFFKTKRIATENFTEEAIFESSGTTGDNTSRHFVKSLELYKKSFLKCFELFYKKPTDWCIIGLLPSYLERKNSSLVFMVKELIALSNHKNSGFYLNELESLKTVLEENEKSGVKTFLIGATFALLDFAEQFSINLKNTTIVETGGMKGRREEMTRKQVHEILKKAFQVDYVHSEYGMTELLSQAYSYGEGIFSCPPWMRVLLRSEDNPLEVKSNTTMSGFKTNGAINIIDMANVHSCAFIATDDIGKLYIDGRFEVLGRLDNSDIRGCSQLTI